MFVFLTIEKIVIKLKVIKFIKLKKIAKKILFKKMKRSVRLFANLNYFTLFDR